MDRADIDYRFLFDNASFGLLILSQKGEIIRTNKELSRFLGYSEEEYLQKNLQDIVSSEDWPVISEIISDIDHCHQNGCQGIAIFNKKDKSQQLFSFNIRKQQKEDNEPYFLVKINKITDVELYQNDKIFFDALMEYFPGLVYFKDRKSRFVKVNKNYLQNTKFRTYHDLIGKTDFDLFTKEHAQQAFDDEQQILKTGVPILNIEEKETWTDGRVRWVLTSKMPWPDERGNIIGTFGFSKDITDKKLREFEILEKTNILNAITSHMPVVIFKYNKQFGITSLYGDSDVINAFADSKMVKLTISKNFSKIIERVAAFKDKEGYFNFSSTNHSPVGDRFFENYIFQHIIGGEEEYIGLALEVTERKLTENKIKKNAKNLERTNRELNQFAYIISHDLKAPLRAISSLSEWIEEDLGEIENVEIKNNLKLLRNRVTRLENLINGILQYSRASRANIVYETLDVGNLINEVVDSLEIPPKFNVKIQKSLPKVTFSKIVLIQVFSNLISNAIIHHDKESGNIELSGKEKGEFYEFAVTDDGPGIEKEYHEKIFTIFQTLKARDSFESIGIGLTIVKKIIEDQGGNIRVESDLGKGTKFIFQIPKENKAND